MFRMDNDDDFTTTEFAIYCVVYCADEGIQRYFSAPCTLHAAAEWCRRVAELEGGGSGMC